jgi:branched-chain amino acid transport system permease protein
MTALASARGRGRGSTGGTRRAWMPLSWVLATGVVIAGPSYLGLGALDTGVTLLSLLAIAQAWNLLAGFGGQVSLGVSAFVGAGGYGITLLFLHTGVGLIPALGLAAAIGAALAAATCPAVFRLRGPYFTVGTLGLALAIEAWMENWSYSGGTQPLTLPFQKVPTPEALYRIAVIVAFVAMAIVWVMRHSDYGLRLMAVRDHEPAARGLGVSAFRVKCLAYIVSGALTALAGAVIAVQSTSVEPTSAFGVGFTVDAVVMTVVGGMGTLVGPLVGVVIVYYGIQQQLQSSAELSQLLTGLLLLIVVRFAPDGVWPLALSGLRRLSAASRRRPSSSTLDKAR